MPSKGPVFRLVVLLGLAALALVRPVAALTEYDYVDVVKRFADAMLSPANIQVVDSINSTLFAEDVYGTVDVSTNFDGRELSTEYLFGLFVNTAKDSAPSLLGSPISYNVTALVVQHSMVSASVIFEFYYAILDKSWPIQIDVFFDINEQGQISQYDITFRRWAWATDTIVPEVIPYMGEALNTTSDNSTYILQQYLADVVCTAAMANCNGSNQQYESYDECHDFVLNIALGEFYRMGENNLLCRNLHVPMLPFRPSVHCPHVGPTGGDMCIDRNYTEVVLQSHFPNGWLAPKYVTPENSKEVSDIYATSGSSLSPLVEISMSSLDTHSWDPTLYATCLLGYFLMFYVVSNIIGFILFRTSSIYPTLSLEHQRNVVIYIMNIIYTMIALALQLCATPSFAGHYGLWQLQTLRTSGVLISALYIFELVYRVKMRLPMIAHHFLTIFAISFTVTVFEYTESMTYLNSAIIWLFQATTEQPTFFGLFGYRMDWNPVTVARLLKFAAIQTFVLKSASAVALIVYWGFNQHYTYRSIDIAWTVLLWIIAVGLLLTQIWGSYVTYAIGQRVLYSSKLPTGEAAGAPTRPALSSSVSGSYNSASTLSTKSESGGAPVVPTLLARGNDVIEKVSTETLAHAA
ncbi:hypothetical protein Q5752_000399 [Cryptotrichosporon argae]